MGPRSKELIVGNSPRVACGERNPRSQRGTLDSVKCLSEKERKKEGPAKSGRTSENRVVSIVFIHTNPAGEGTKRTCRLPEVPGGAQVEVRTSGLIQVAPTGTPWVGATLLLEVLFLKVEGVVLGVGVLTTVMGVGGTIGARVLVLVVVVTVTSSSSFLLFLLFLKVFYF